MHFSSQRWFAGATVCLLVLAGCSRQVPTAYLANIGSGGITVAEFEKELAYRQKANLPIISKEAILEDMINRQVLAQKARALKMDADYEMKRAFEGMLAERLKEKQLDQSGSSNVVSDAEVEARFKQDIQRYTQPAKARLALLTLQFSKTASAEQKKELQNRLMTAREKFAELPEGTVGFGPLAIDFSDDQVSRYRGGDVGWYDEGVESRWPQKVLQAGFALEPGKVSGLIETDKGFFLAMKTDSRPASVTPLDKVAESIRRRLLWEKQKQQGETFLAEARAGLGITTHLELLENIPLQPTLATNKEDTAPPSLP